MKQTFPFSLRIFSLLAGIALLISCKSDEPIQPVAHSARKSSVHAATFKSEKLAEIDSVIQQAIAENKCPGGVLWIERQGAKYHKAYGNRALVPESEVMSQDTIFDSAS